MCLQAYPPHTAQLFSATTRRKCSCDQLALAGKGAVGAARSSPPDQPDGAACARAAGPATYRRFALFPRKCPRISSRKSRPFLPRVVFALSPSPLCAMLRRLGGHWRPVKGEAAERGEELVRMRASLAKPLASSVSPHLLSADMVAFCLSDEILLHIFFVPA